MTSVPVSSLIIKCRTCRRRPTAILTHRFLQSALEFSGNNLKTSESADKRANQQLFILKKEEGRMCDIDVMNGESGSRFEIKIFLSLHEECGRASYIALFQKRWCSITIRSAKLLLSSSFLSCKSLSLHLKPYLALGHACFCTCMRGHVILIHYDAVAQCSLILPCPALVAVSLINTRCQ